MKYLIQKERVELFAPNLDIEVVADLKGSIREEELSKAVEKAVNSQELLQCKIEINEAGEAFYSTADKREIVIHSFQDDWMSIVAKQEMIPFDLEHGELVRFFAKYEEDGVQLLIIAHHLAGDGLSITYLFEDIVNALNGQPIEYKKVTLFDTSTLPKDSKLNPMVRFMMKRTNKNWKKNGKVFTFTDYQSMFQKYWNIHKTQIIYDSIETKMVQRIKMLAKQHKITVNSLLTTIFLQAQSDVNEVGITVRLTPKNGEIRGNQSTAVSTKYAYDETKDFWENAAIIHQSIYQKLNRNKEKYFLMQFLKSLSPTLIDANYFAAFDGYDNKVAVAASDMFGYRGNDKKNISISNLTAPEFNLVSGDVTLHNITFVPPIVTNAKCMIGIITYEEKMTISWHTVYKKESCDCKKVFEKALVILKNL